MDSDQLFIFVTRTMLVVMLIVFASIDWFSGLMAAALCVVAYLMGRQDEIIRKIAELEQLLKELD